MKQVGNCRLDALVTCVLDKTGRGQPPGPSCNALLSPGLPLPSPLSSPLSSRYSTSCPLSEPQAVLCFQNHRSPFCFSSCKGRLWSLSLWSSAVGAAGAPSPGRARVGSVSGVLQCVPLPSACRVPPAADGSPFRAGTASGRRSVS